MRDQLLKKSLIFVVFFCGFHIPFAYGEKVLAERLEVMTAEEAILRTQFQTILCEVKQAAQSHSWGMPTPHKIYRESLKRLRKSLKLHQGWKRFEILEDELTNLSDKWAEPLITKGKNLFYLLIGFVHGLSNLGGAPLAVLASSIYKDNKRISSNIAFVYFVLAISQLIVLYTYKSELFVPSYLIFIPVVILNHLVLRKILFPHIDNSKFKIFINLVILTFGVICVA